MSDAGQEEAAIDTSSSGSESAERTTVFVSDPSAEAERVAQLLRATGYQVVDVPMSMLLARVAAQQPRVVLVDADAEGARELGSKLREAVGTPAIEVLFLGCRQGRFEHHLSTDALLGVEEEGLELAAEQRLDADGGTTRAKRARRIAGRRRGRRARRDRRRRRGRGRPHLGGQCRGRLNDGIGGRR